MTKPAKERLHFLDMLRGLAALAVVCTHATEYNSRAGYVLAHNFFNFGKFGVAVFFLVSGFVIPYTLERQGSVKLFLINRFFRLYPLYWLSLLAFVVLWRLGIVFQPTDYYAEFARHFARNLALNATMFQESLRIPDAIAVYWTLAIELAFYLSCVVLFRAGLAQRSLPIAWIALTITALAGIALPFLIHHRTPFAGLFSITTLYVGTVLFRLYTGKVEKRQVALLIAATLVVAALGSFMNYRTYTNTDQIALPAALFPWISAYGLFLLAFSQRARSFSPILIWLGSISYSMYLLHPLVFNVVQDRLPQSWVIAVGLPATLIVSTLTYRVLEKPCIDWGHAITRAGAKRRGDARRNVIESVA